MIDNPDNLDNLDTNDTNPTVESALEQIERFVNRPVPPIADDRDSNVLLEEARMERFGK